MVPFIIYYNIYIYHIHSVIWPVVEALLPTAVVALPVQSLEYLQHRSFRSDSSHIRNPSRTHSLWIDPSIEFASMRSLVSHQILSSSRMSDKWLIPMGIPCIELQSMLISSSPWSSHTYPSCWRPSGFTMGEIPSRSTSSHTLWTPNHLSSPNIFKLHQYLFNSQVSIYWSISCSSSQVLILLVGNMFPVLLNVPLRQSEVNNVHFMSPTIIFTQYLLPVPMRKLSGFTSRWRKCRECTYSIRWIIWSASISTVFNENLRPQRLNRSSNDGPNKSITIILYSPIHNN